MTRLHVQMRRGALSQVPTLQRLLSGQASEKCAVAVRWARKGGVGSVATGVTLGCLAGKEEKSNATSTLRHPLAAPRLVKGPSSTIPILILPIRHSRS